MSCSPLELVIVGVFRIQCGDFAVSDNTTVPSVKNELFADSLTRRISCPHRSTNVGQSSCRNSGGTCSHLQVVAERAAPSVIAPFVLVAVDYCAGYLPRVPDVLPNRNLQSLLCRDFTNDRHNGVWPESVVNASFKLHHDRIESDVNQFGVSRNGRSARATVPISRRSAVV
jgi:hypothetical protein